MNMANVEIALEIMAKGMGGIFVAIVVIMAAVMVLGKITGKMKDKEEEQPIGTGRRQGVFHDCSYKTSGGPDYWNEALQQGIAVRNCNKALQ